LAVYGRPVVPRPCSSSFVKVTTPTSGARPCTSAIRGHGRLACSGSPASIPSSSRSTATRSGLSSGHVASEWTHRRGTGGSPVGFRAHAPMTRGFPFPGEARRRVVTSGAAATRRAMPRRVLDGLVLFPVRPHLVAPSTAGSLVPTPPLRILRACPTGAKSSSSSSRRMRAATTCTPLTCPGCTRRARTSKTRPRAPARRWPSTSRGCARTDGASRPASSVARSRFLRDRGPAGRSGAQLIKALELAPVALPGGSLGLALRSLLPAFGVWRLRPGPASGEHSIARLLEHVERFAREAVAVVEEPQEGDRAIDDVSEHLLLNGDLAWKPLEQELRQVDARPPPEIPVRVAALPVEHRRADEVTRSARPAHPADTWASPTRPAHRAGAR